MLFLHGIQALQSAFMYHTIINKAAWRYFNEAVWKHLKYSSKIKRELEQQSLAADSLPSSRLNKWSDEGMLNGKQLPQGKRVWEREREKAGLGYEDHSNVKLTLHIADLESGLKALVEE
jgi:hypothetical protein